MTGIHSYADLMDRCHVDPDTGCWHWRLGRDSSGAPSMWSPVLRQRVRLGTMFHLLENGERCPRGYTYICTCSTEHCANRLHREYGRWKSAKSAKRKKTQLQKAKISATKRAKSTLSDDAVMAIINSDSTIHEAAKEYGISPSYASRIRRGERRATIGIWQGMFT